MLEFKTRQTENEDASARWSIGVDRRHVGVYVGLALFIGIALGFVLGRYVSRKETPTTLAANDPQIPTRAVTADPESEFHNVTRILRADTIDVESFGAVRMLGIETPDGKTPVEIYGVHGQHAMSYAEKTLLGQPVKLEFDSTASQAKDDSGAVLAYVYTRDGLLINAEMVRQGLAFVRGAEQFRMANDFRGFERGAMQSMRGVWGPASGDIASNITSGITSGADTASTRVPEEKSKPEDKSKKLAPLPPSALGANIPAISGSPTGSFESQVWVSPGDKMYHKSICSFLDKKKHSIPLSQAKTEGYTACSRCYASTLLKAP